MRIVDLVAELGEDAARERAAAAAVLAQVMERLEEMAVYLGGLDDERRTRLDDAESLDTTVLTQVTNLSSEVHGATELPSLRALVASRLGSAAKQVRAFRARQDQRFVEHSARSEVMRARIVELERESHELNRKHERKRSRVDPLTKVANRPAFDERLAAELPRLRRFHTPLSLLLRDNDRFKEINESYGHRIGDAVLREVPTCLIGQARATDLVARYGGEEFGMLPVGTPAGEAPARAKQLRRAIAALGFRLKGTPVVVTASCGITELRARYARERLRSRGPRAERGEGQRPKPLRHGLGNRPSSRRRAAACARASAADTTG